MLFDLVIACQKNILVFACRQHGSCDRKIHPCILRSANTYQDIFLTSCTFPRQRGFLSLVAVVLIMVMGFLGMALTYMLISGSASTTNYLQSSKALYLAEAGLEHATHVLNASSFTNRAPCLALTISNTLGAGSYSVATTGPFYVSSPSTLNGAITSTATIIPVVSTANYQASGRLMIDRELVNYAAISGNNFVGVIRGVSSTTAAAHNSATPVAQFQCALSSQGGVPSLTSPVNPGSPSGKRQIQDAVQLQEAWAVGNSSNNNFRIMRWNRPTEEQWSNASIAASNISFNSVSMVSYVDGWAVGGTNTFLHWTGSAWTSVATGLTNVAFFGVYCTDGDNCHAVGNAQGGTPVIGHWNGTAWTRITPGGSISGANLRSVHCDAINDCWAAGTNSGGGRFYQWNGTTWTGISLAGLSGYTFNGVFCNTSTDCWAVGANATFARKSGASWANFATGLPAAQYNGIFCNSSTDCWAVGNTNGGRDLIVHWNGTAWSRDASNPTPATNLFEVSCANINDCWAVGANSSFVHWDGTSWTTFTTSGLPSVQLNGIDIVFHPTLQPQAAWQENFA